MSEIDYRFDGGFFLETTSFTPKGPEALYPLAIPAEDLVVPTTEQFQKELARVDSELRNVRRERATIVDTQRSLEFAIINDDTASLADRDDIAVFHFAWGGSTKNPVGAREMQMLGALYPEQRFMIVNNDGVAGLDMLSRKARKEMARTGSYEPYAQFANRALCRVLDDFGSKKFIGPSQGGRKAIALAGRSSDVSDVIVTDPPGSRQQKVWQLMKSFSKVEAEHSAVYAAVSADEESSELQAQLDSPLTVMRTMAGLALRDALWSQLVQQPRAMAKAGLENDLSIATKKIKGSLIINSPEFSALNDPEDVRGILGRIAMSDKRPESIVQRVMLGHTHAFQAGNPIAQARMFMEI